MNLRHFPMFRRQSQTKLPTQKEVVQFMLDEKTIDRAARGSMQKRNELIRRVEASRIRAA